MLLCKSYISFLLSSQDGQLWCERQSHSFWTVTDSIGMRSYGNMSNWAYNACPPAIKHIFICIRSNKEFQIFVEVIYINPSVLEGTYVLGCFTRPVNVAVSLIYIDKKIYIICDYSHGSYVHIWTCSARISYFYTLLSVIYALYSV